MVVLTIGIRAGHSRLLSEIQGLLICVFEINFFKEESSTARPPSLYGSNFAYLKTYLKEFIKALHEKSWEANMLGELYLFGNEDEQSQSDEGERNIHVKKRGVCFVSFWNLGVLQKLPKGEIVSAFLCWHIFGKMCFV